jgi:hypothetical protein
MSKVTLDDLRADFDKAVLAHFRISKARWWVQCFLNRHFPTIAYWYSESPYHCFTVDHCARKLSENKANEWPVSVLKFTFPQDVARTANIYIIARDQGLNAAMLWKLAN